MEDEKGWKCGSCGKVSGTNLILPHQGPRKGLIVGIHRVEEGDGHPEDDGG